MSRNIRIKARKRQREDELHPGRNESSEKIDLGHLPNLVGYALRRAQISVFRDFLKSFSKANIRPIQYGILTVIERNPGLKQSQVCAALGIKRANFVALLNNLERRNLAERAPTANDQRANALYLTKKGRLLMRKLREINKMHESRMTAALRKEERSQLILLLNRVIATAKNGH